mmetsp:Transcript_12321/g.24830  ORF Transcript_12321/g.24830 Transcript_12321/m.24830 type:complete len:221 (+) Transcript_12321:592-1254(+)
MMNEHFVNFANGRKALIACYAGHHNTFITLTQRQTLGRSKDRPEAGGIRVSCHHDLTSRRIAGVDSHVVEAVQGILSGVVDRTALGVVVLVHKLTPSSSHQCDSKRILVAVSIITTVKREQKTGILGSDIRPLIATHTLSRNHLRARGSIVVIIIIIIIVVIIHVQPTARSVFVNIFGMHGCPRAHIIVEQIDSHGNKFVLLVFRASATRTTPISWGISR